MAGISGQQEAWGEFGTDPSQLLDPSFMGVDSTDGSVFVASYDFDFAETFIKKFSSSGDLEGTVSIPGLASVGIAINEPDGTFYVLEDEEVGSEEFVATKILAFKTTPVGGVLPAATSPELPVPTGTLIAPQEIVFDQHTGDLVVLAENGTHEAVLQRISTSGSGSVGATWVGALSAVQQQRGIAVDAAGVTYLVSSNSNGEQISAETLPAEFTAASTLTAVPGFAAAVPSTPGGFQAEPPSSLEGVNYGPQLAVSTSADGGDTLFWKSLEIAPVGAQNQGDVVISGYSVDGKAKTVVYGGGSTEGSCMIQALRAALAPGPDGSLVVLDQGQEIGEESQTPAWFPAVYRFGPGGSQCPAPAASLKLESGGTAVTTVPAGSSVTLSGTGSELQGATLVQAKWVVTGQEEFTASAAGLTTVAAGHFAQEGTYTVRMILETAPISGHEQFGTTFSTAPQTLVVTAPSTATEFALNLTKSGTGSGSFECKVDGGPAEPCEAEYDTGIEVEVLAKSATGSKFVNWTGACNGTGPCVVTMSQAQNVGGVFDLESAPGTEFTLTVTAPSGGALLCNSGSGAIACAAQAKYASGKVVTLTEAPASGFEFAGWTGDCSGTGACSVTMTAAHTVGATFKAVSQGGGGNTGGGGNAGGGGSGGGGGGGTVHPGGGGKPHQKTPAQILAEKRQKAIAKCKKAKGTAKAKCLKKANEIGKPKKKKPKKKGVKAREFDRVLGRTIWQG